jgi:metal-responsive CopG/Arc/MetJ family transcriptional regulator
MKTAISLPNRLFEETEAAAKDLGISRSRLIQTALEDFLKRRREDAIAASLNRYLEKHGADLSKEDEILLEHARQMARRVEWDE